MKYTDASDDAYDKKHKIIEGSKADIKLDAARGVAETDMTHPFGHAKVKAQRDTTKGHVKALVMGDNKPAMVTASSFVKGSKPKKGAGKMPF